MWLNIPEVENKPRGEGERGTGAGESDDGCGTVLVLISRRKDQSVVRHALRKEARPPPQHRD